jgi:acyl-coenzyme A synthetase/AMP-(fatty) acid ligase
LIEFIRGAAERDPQQPAVCTAAGEVSYGTLLADARATAAAFHVRGLTRVAVLEHDVGVVLRLLGAGALSGVEVCLYPPDASSEQVGDLAARFDHEVVVTRRDQDVPAGVTAIDPADLLSAAADAALPAPQRRPLLVLTTGTTGAPRGTRQDWDRLTRATGHIKPAPGERWLFAYAVQQFGGLQLLMHVMAAGATLVAPESERPRDGLAAIRRHGADHVSATPTYWRFLLAELAGTPPPELAQITLSGEAVPALLLDQLRAAFPTARITQIYGASEFGSNTAIRDGRHGLAAHVLERSDDADVAFRIVDGELWVRSRIGMLGYYGEDGTADPDDWRATGDLVDIVDGRIEFRGRASEVINVGGVKVHPLVVEERVAAVPGVRMARVYGRPNPLSGAIVAVDVLAEPGAEPDPLKDAIRDACADLPAAARPRSIKLVDVLTTAGHKIIRRAVDDS